MNTKLILRFSCSLFLCLILTAIKLAAATGFIENNGQIKDQYFNPRNDIAFKLNGADGLNIFVSPTGLQYQWQMSNSIYRLDMELVGANKHATITTDLEDGYRELYNIGNSKIHARKFGKVTFHEVYPGIDWVLYLTVDGKLEHDFILKHGAKTADIKIHYAGANEIVLDKKGNLNIKTAYGSIREYAPYAYEQNSQRKIASSYLLKGNELQYKVAPYKGILVIDPVIDWATYIGGSEYEEVWDTQVGKDGMVYITGATNSLTNIATIGAHLTTFAGGTNAFGSDIFLMKFNPQGSCLWATYIGGSNVDQGLSMAIDTTGNLYVAGRTNSQNGISTTGAYQELKAGSNASYDAFLVKFDTAGQLLWGTYYGGTGAEATDRVAVTVDRYNQVYLCGNTQSASAIATPGSFMATRPGSNDGFIAKFNPSGNRIWATYFGTVANDAITAIATDTSGNVVVTGFTQSTSGLASPGVYQQTGNGGQDAFVAKFDSAGNRIFATYYGGPAYEYPYNITTDSAGNIYFTGGTESQSGISSSGAYQALHGGGNTDLFLAKLTPLGTMAWSTYFGGPGNELNSDVDFDNGVLYVSGETSSASAIATPDGIKAVYDNSVSEILMATFDPMGNRNWATYLGGDVSETGKSICAHGTDIYIGGSTNSVNNLATPGAHQVVFEGLTDGLLMKIKICDLPEEPGIITGKITICEGEEETYQVPPVNGATSYQWLFPSGWTGASAANSIVLTAGSGSGVVKVLAINSCGTSDTAALIVTVNPAPQPTISQTGNILTVMQSFSSYQWMRNGLDLVGATGSSYAVMQNGTYRLRVSGTNGCEGLSNEIEITNSSSIDDVLTEKGISVSPNPFNGFISLKMPQNGTIRLADIAGKVTLTQKVKTGENTITTDDIAAGTYFLQVYDADGGMIGASHLIKITP